jgi:hypothetical protein
LRNVWAVGATYHRNRQATNGGPLSSWPNVQTLFGAAIATPSSPFSDWPGVGIGTEIQR